MRVGRPIKAPITVKCDYCGQPAILRKFGDMEYPYTAERRPVWICVPCQAWIQVRPGKENKPLGRLAKEDLREAKRSVHAALEPFVERKVARDKVNVFEARAKALRWAAAGAGLDNEHNIHALTLEQCERVTAFVREYLSRRAAKE